MYCKRDNVIQLVYDIKAGISYSEGTEEGPRATIFHFSIYLTLWQQSLAYIQVLFVYLYQFSICVACFQVSGTTNLSAVRGPVALPPLVQYLICPCTDSSNCINQMFNFGVL